MPTARYKFVRDTGVPGGLSNNSASTDAILALSDWSNSHSRRSYDVQVDEDNILIAELTWDDADDASPGLDAACVEWGVQRSYVKT